METSNRSTPYAYACRLSSSTMSTGPDSSDALFNGAVVPSLMISAHTCAQMSAAFCHPPEPHRTLTRRRAYCEMGVHMPCMLSARVTSTGGSSWRRTVPNV